MGDVASTIGGVAFAPRCVLRARGCGGAAPMTPPRARCFGESATTSVLSAWGAGADATTPEPRARSTGAGAPTTVLRPHAPDHHSRPGVVGSTPVLCARSPGAVATTTLLRARGSALFIDGSPAVPSAPPHVLCFVRPPAPPMGGATPLLEAP